MPKNKSESWWIIYRFSWLDKKRKRNNKSYQLKDNKCFQYAVTVVLNHEELKKDPQRITKINLLSINIKGMEKIFRHKMMIRKNLKKIATIALYVLYAKKEKNISSLCFKI